MGRFRYCALVFITLFCTGLSWEKPYVGVSSFAILHRDFDCKAYLRILKKNQKPAISFLWGTFGNDFRCIKRALHEVRGRSHVLQIHFSNETCRRQPRTCYAGELFKDLRVNGYNKKLERMSGSTMRKLISRMAAIQNFLVANATLNTRVIISGGLEDNYTEKAWGNLYTLLKEVLDYEIVRNPIGEDIRDLSGADFIELHGFDQHFRGRACIANNDGSNGTLSDFRRLFQRNQGCLAVIFWERISQGIEGDKFIRPRKRNPRFVGRVVKMFDTLLRELGYETVL
jgi:hypothetical protein